MANKTGKETDISNEVEVVMNRSISARQEKTTMTDKVKAHMEANGLVKLETENYIGEMKTGGPKPPPLNEKNIKRWVTDVVLQAIKEHQTAEFEELKRKASESDSVLRLRKKRSTT